MEPLSEPKKITLRELSRNTRKIKEAIKRGERFVVYERNTPLFDLSPTGTLPNTQKGLRELKSLAGCIKTEPRTQKNDDEIVYGI